MKVTIPEDVATDLLFRYRSLIDGERGGEIQVVDAKGVVLFRMKLKRPCAPDPAEGTMALYEPEQPSPPEAAGVCALAMIVSDGENVVLMLDVGESGSNAAIEVSKLKVGLDDVVRARSRLIFNW